MTHGDWQHEQLSTPDRRSTEHSGQRDLEAASLSNRALCAEDVDALATAYRRASNRFSDWALVIVGIGGLGAASGLIGVAEQHGWAHWLEPVFFAGGWAVLLGCFVLVRHRQKKIQADHQLACPGCGSPFLGITGPVTATGVCPRCGAQMFTP